MPKITFLPMNQTCDAEVGESLLEVALRNDIPIQHACGGFCACATCHVQVESGLDQLSEREEDEQERLEEGGDSLVSGSRLACQSKIQGDAKVLVVHQE